MPGHSDYDVAVYGGGLKTPLVHHRGPIPKVSGLTVRRTNGLLQLVYVDPADPTNGPGVVLDEGNDPGGDLTMERRDVDEGLAVGDPVVKTVSEGE